MNESVAADRSPAPGALARGALGLVYDREVLGKVLSDLRAKGYRLATFDCRKWETPLAGAQEMATTLVLPESMPRTLEMVGAWLSELAHSDAPYGDERLRLAVVLGVFDDFAARHRAEALLLVDQLGQASRMAVMFDHRVLAVVQSDDPGFHLAAVPTLAIDSRQTFRDGLWPPHPAEDTA